MRRTTVEKYLMGTAAAALLSVAASGPAEAARIVGRWDPLFGGVFPSLGWEATAQIDVPDACLAQADGTYSTSAGACVDFGFANVIVDFYNAADSAQTTLASFSLATTPVSVTNLTINNNMLVGLNAGPFNFFTPPADGPGSIWGNGVYSFSLFLEDSGVGASTTNRAQLAYNDLSKNSSPFCWAKSTDPSVCGISAVSLPGVFTHVVPEPQLPALVMAGLAALAFSLRKRKI